MLNIRSLIAVTFCALTIISCSSKEIDDKNAVSAFADNNLMKVDPALSNTQVVVPKMVVSQSWFGSNNDNNDKIENFSFTTTISKVKSVWAGYRPGYEDRMVFAPVIAKDKDGDKIYILDGNGNLYARNLSNYKTIWKKRLVDIWSIKNFTNGKISYYDGKGLNTPPSFADANSTSLNRGIVFASTGYNMVIAVDAKSGDILWQKTLGAIPISAPISDGSQVFVTTNDNKTYALNIKNGEINWIHSGILKAAGILGAANPVSYKNYVIVAYSSGEIYVLNKKSGEVGWVYDLNINKADSSDFLLNDIDATPVVKDGIVYAIGNGGLMMAIRIADGLILWQKELASVTDFWIAGDFIYLINNQDQLICLHKKTGGIKWFKQLKKYSDDKDPNTRIVYNGIVMAGSNLIVTNSNRELLVVWPLDGTVLQTKQLDQRVFHNPIIVGGKLYIYTLGRFNTDLTVVE